MPGAGFEIPAASDRRLIGTIRRSWLVSKGTRRSQVVEIGGAVATADFLQMKSDVFRRARIEHTEQILAKFIATWARQSTATPNHTDAVQTCILSANHHRQAFTQIIVVAKLTFDQRQLVNRQRFLEVCTQYLVAGPSHRAGPPVAEVALTSTPFASESFASSLSAAGSSAGLGGHGGITFPSAPFALAGVEPRNEAT